MGQVFFFAVLLLVLLGLCGWMVYNMVRTGKPRAKGAKRRRAKVLPFLYRKPKQKRRKHAKKLPEINPEAATQGNKKSDQPVS